MNGDKSNAEIGDVPTLSRDVVGERSCCSEDHAVRQVGAAGSENVGMSSEIMVKIHNAVSPRFPSQRSSRTG